MESTVGQGLMVDSHDTVLEMKANLAVLGFVPQGGR
jgi:hypothetical protein